MKRISYIIVTLILLAGCKRQQPLPEPVIDEIAMSKDNYKLDYKEQTLTLEFETNAEYRFEISADWITLIDADSRSLESYAQSFAVAENTTQDERSTYIKIVAGEVEYAVTVTQGVKPEMFNLTIKHSAMHLDSPVWSGENVGGEIEWGDGCKEAYSEGISHDYTSDEQHSAKFEMTSVDGFEIEQLGEIEHIEIAY